MEIIGHRKRQSLGAYLLYVSRGPWRCGDDCIVLYFPKRRQFGVYVGGPNNEWLPFSSAARV